MRKIVLILSVLTALLFGVISCQIYDQATNKVVYSMMDGEAASIDDLTKRIEKSDSTADLILVAKQYSAEYTGISDEFIAAVPGALKYKTSAVITADIYTLWEKKYPTEWDFKRK